MTNNPDPTRITAEMWKLWESRPNLVWKLSGIYADKPGYHNTVIVNRKKWPNNYSIKEALDIVKINNDKARAIDLTMTDAEMVKCTTRMRNSAQDPNDPRLGAVKEFYGTLDNKNVFGLSKDTTDGPWRRSSADSTHLWHVHTSIYTSFVANWGMLSPLLSVWSGESLENWKVQAQAMFINKGDTGPEVSYYQALHNAIRNTVTPPAPEVKVDGVYGDALAKAFTDIVHKQGGQTAYNGQSTPYWFLLRMQSALITANAPDASPTPAVDAELMKSLVTEWLATNVPNNLTITADLKGKVTL
jgi:hypothetical protein